MAAKAPKEREKKADEAAAEKVKTEVDRALARAKKRTVERLKELTKPGQRAASRVLGISQPYVASATGEGVKVALAIAMHDRVLVDRLLGREETDLLVALEYVGARANPSSKVAAWELFGRGERKPILDWVRFIERIEAQNIATGEESDDVREAGDQTRAGRDATLVARRRA